MALLIFSPGTFLVVAPETVRPGLPYSVSVNLLKSLGNRNTISVQIIDESTDETISRTQIRNVRVGQFLEWFLYKRRKNSFHWSVCLQGSPWQPESILSVAFCKESATSFTFVEEIHEGNSDLRLKRLWCSDKNHCRFLYRLTRLSTSLETQVST